MSKLNAAVIGVGQMGQHHARNYSEILQTNLVAIADKDPQVGQPLANRFKVPFYPDYRQMLKNEKIDLVSIAVPTRLHKQVAFDCISGQKHILIEKPIALNVAEAKQIVQKAKNKGIKFTVGHIERFNPSVIKLKEMIDQGKLGEIVSISAFRLGPTPNRIKDANVVIDIGVHDIDIMNWFFGRLPEKVYARGGSVLNQGKEDHIEAFLNYGRGGGLIVANWITPHKIRKLTVSGKKAYVELNYITQEIQFYQSNVMLSYDDYGDFLVKFGNSQDKKIIKVKNIEPLKAEITSFVKAIKENKKPLVTAREAIDALSIAYKISRQISHHA